MAIDDHKIRIIGGSFKGRRLEVFDLEGLRPTTNRVRETVFNWISDKVINANVLDLFAGSGALGLEALSRGAQHVVLVEKDRANANILKSTIETLPKDIGTAQVINQDALSFIPSYKSQGGQPFDLVFLDPPFASDLLEKSVELLVQNELLADDALVYVEMGKAKKKPLFGLEMLREDTMGVAHFGLYQKSFFL